ncbi:SMP-30/gluconolactonase/LRE family protein [Neorhizobium sp. LMR1-1-1.1]
MTQAVLLDASLPACQLGEGIHWDEHSSSLWWVDIVQQSIHRYELAQKLHQSWTVSKQVSFVFPRQDGQILVGLADGVYEFDPDTGDEFPIALLDLPHDHRLNDGKLDPAGRLWVGTIDTSPEPSETAALYLLEGDHLQEVEGGYTNANGKAWSVDEKVMFHADTGRDTIWVYDYNLEDGSLANKRVFAKTVNGRPDGLEADDEGRLYAAIFGGSRVDILSIRGEIVGKVDLAAPNVTSCCLGGLDRRTLFITTAFDGMSDEERRSAPLSGQVFQFELHR